MKLIKNISIPVLILIVSYLLFCPIWYSSENYNDRGHGKVIRDTSIRFGIFKWMEFRKVTFMVYKDEVTKPADSIILPGAIATGIAFIGLFVFVMIYEKKKENSN